MAQFSVYQNKNAQTKKSFPYLLDVQSNLLSELATTVVIPLARFDQSRTKILTRLTPVLRIDQHEYVVLTPQLAGIQRKELGKLARNIRFIKLRLLEEVEELVASVNKKATFSKHFSFSLQVMANAIAKSWPMYLLKNSVGLV
jgi:toxin CcdB